MYKQDVELNEILSYIKLALEEGYELEFSLDYNGELKELPNDKLYTIQDVKQMDYIKFISDIYNHFRSIERQQLYEFRVNLLQDEKNTNFYYDLCAFRPFGGNAGYKYGGGSGTFGMRIFLTNKNLLFKQLEELLLPNSYNKIGIDFIKKEHPFFLNNISSVKEHIIDIIHGDVIKQLIEDNQYDLEQRDMKFEELKELVTRNIESKYNINDFDITIEKRYDNFYFKLSNKYLGDIIKLAQRKEVQIDYYLDEE